MKRLSPNSWNRIVPAGAALAAAIALLAPGAAQATPYVVKLIQKGNNVVAVGSGSIDLKGLTISALGSDGSGGMWPFYAYVGVGVPSSLVAYTGFKGPKNFGSGGDTGATSSTGDYASILGNPAYYGRVLLFVPPGYGYGTATLSGRSILDNANAANLGVHPSIYKWTWGTGKKPDQSFTLDAFMGVPEPAALGMLGFGLLLVGGFLKLRPRPPGSA